MKSWLQQFIEEEADNLYCPYCMEPKGDKHSCCDEVHFIAFKDFDDDTQRQIAIDEWEMRA